MQSQAQIKLHSTSNSQQLEQLVANCYVTTWKVFYQMFMPLEVDVCSLLSQAWYCSVMFSSRPVTEYLLWTDIKQREYCQVVGVFERNTIDEIYKHLPFKSQFLCPTRH